MGKVYTKKLKIILQSKLFYFVFLILAFVFCIVKIHCSNDNKELLNTTFEGKIIDYIWKDEEKKVEITVQSQKKNYLIKLSYSEKTEELKETIQYGGIISAAGKCLISNKNTIPNTFNYQKYLKSKKIEYVIEVNHIKLKKSGNMFNKIHQKIRENIEKRPNSFYLKMLLLGIKENDETNIMDCYRQNGIIHLFVISGMHLSFIYLLANKIGKKLIKKAKIVTIFSIIILTCYYTILTKSISSERAFYFYVLQSISILANLKLNSKQIFLLNLSIQLFKNPFIIYQTGFQYSFLLSFTYIFFLSKKKNIFRIALITFLVSLPITINQNFEINPWSILANLIFIPIITSILFPLLILSVVISPIHFILNPIIKFIEWSNLIFNKLPLSHIIVPKISIILILLYYFFLFCYLKTEKRTNLLFLNIVLIVCYFSPKLDFNAYLYFLDVGQGDSICFISPHQKEVILIDTGNKSEWLANNITTFFKSLGIKKINYLILTHGDYDHIGNSVHLVNNFKIENVIFNIGTYNKLEKELIQKLNNKIKYYNNLKELNIYNNKIYFLNTGIYDNENDNSNVIYFNYNDYKFLLMGDASTKREEDILNKYNLKDIDFFKVGHHGSNTSSSKEFINTISPKNAIISVGKKNRYGHPKEEVLKTLSNSTIYRTDINGSIQVKLNTKGYKISTCSP